MTSIKEFYNNNASNKITLYDMYLKERKLRTELNSITESTKNQRELAKKLDLKIKDKLTELKDINNQLDLVYDQLQQSKIIIFEKL